jgi:hypothetical protein
MLCIAQNTWAAMHQLLMELSGKFDLLTTRGHIIDVMAGLEEVYDPLSDSEQKTLRRMIEKLYRSLRQLSPCRDMLHVVDVGHALACTVDNQRIQLDQDLRE